MWWIRGLSTLLAPISLVVRFAFAARLRLGTFLVSASASALGVMFAGDRRAVRTFVVTFGTLSRSSRAVVETGVCVHHRPTGGFAFNSRVQFSCIIRREQNCDFVHIVEDSDFARDRLCISYRLCCLPPLFAPRFCSL